MTIAFLHSGSPVTSAKALLAKYSTYEFDSPGRSIVPSLTFWMDAVDQFTELCSTEKPEGGYLASLPSDEWVRPFRLFLPMSGNGTVTIFGKVPEYEDSRQKFVVNMRNAS
ncbi:MAG: hypothetical protein ABIK28_11990 [Planctomycetota bacterium]